MPVYVDPLRKWGGNKQFRWPVSCHMYADTLVELHEMADKVGMRRRWFQNDERLPHYDLRPERRVVALAHGAVEHTRRQMVQFMRDQRHSAKDLNTHE